MKDASRYVIKAIVNVSRAKNTTLARGTAVAMVRPRFSLESLHRRYCDSLDPRRKRWATGDDDHKARELRGTPFSRWNFGLVLPAPLPLKYVPLRAFKSVRSIYTRRGRTWVMFQDDGGWRLSWRCLACTLSPYPPGSAILHNGVLDSSPAMPIVASCCLSSLHPRLRGTHNCSGEYRWCGEASETRKWLCAFLLHGRYKRKDRERARDERRARSEAKWREGELARKEHAEKRKREGGEWEGESFSCASWLNTWILIKHAHRDYREQVKALFLCRGLRVCGYLCGAMLRRYPLSPPRSVGPSPPPPSRRVKKGLPEDSGISANHETFKRWESADVRSAPRLLDLRSAFAGLYPSIANALA